jgi:small subunit ribosomal protein S11
MSEKPAKKEEAKVEDKAKAKPRAKKNKVAKHVTSGRVYIQATYNNTVVTITDLQGNVLAWSTSGHMGFRGPKKATPYAAGMVVKDVADKVKEMGMVEVHTLIKGVGQGRDGALRALHAQGFSVLSIRDITPIPHNGPRACKPRRV